MFNFLRYMSCCNGEVDQNPSVSENVISHVEHIIYFPILNNSTKSSIINIKYTTLNGLLDGVHLLYDRNCKLLSKSHYKQGELDGEEIHYDFLVRSIEGFEKYHKSVTLYSNGIRLGNELLIKKKYCEK
jgi:hypothetical protein